MLLMCLLVVDSPPQYPASVCERERGGGGCRGEAAQNRISRNTRQAFRSSERGTLES